MAGGVLRAFGTFLIVVGVLGLAVGGGLAGFTILSESQKSGFERAFSDQQMVEQRIFIGLVVAGGGLILLIVGLVLRAAGQARFERALLQTVSERRSEASSAELQAPSAPDNPPRRRSKSSLAAIATAGLVAAALLVVLAQPAIFEQVQPSATTGSKADHVAGPISEDRFEGVLRGSASTPLGALNSPASESIGEFRLPDQTSRIVVNLTWQATTGGAERLEMILEAKIGSDWKELGRAEGKSSVQMEQSVTDLGGGSVVRTRVFAGGTAIVTDQPFALGLTYWP